MKTKPIDQVEVDYATVHRGKSGWVVSFTGYSLTYHAFMASSWVDRKVLIPYTEMVPFDGRRLTVHDDLTAYPVETTHLLDGTVADVLRKFAEKQSPLCRVLKKGYKVGNPTGMLTVTT